MKKKNVHLLLACLIVFQFSNAQNYDADLKPTEEQDNWSFYVAPYVMFAAQATDVGGEQIRQSFNDLTSLTNSGFQIVGGIRYKKWTASFDSTFAHLGFDENNDVLNIELKIIQNILDLRLGYMVYENFEFDDTEAIKGWSIQVNAGTKYWRNDVGVDYVLGIGDNIITEGNIEEIQRWWDLMIGFKLNFVLNKKVLLGVSGSGGGFGIGNASDFSYDFTYTNSFYIKKYLWINAGFRNFKYKRTDLADGTELKTTVNVLGPLLGLTFKL